MIAHLVEHVRSNVIAYLALVLAMLALSGGAYAAWVVPPHSVGARQIRNHAVGALKLDPRTIGGSIRHWAEVAAAGNIVSSSSRARDTGIPRDGDYLINWSDAFSSRCIPMATIIGTGGVLSPAAGFANARIVGGHPTRVWVSTYNPQAAPTPEPFSIAVVC